MRDPISLDLYHHLVFSLFSSSDRFLVISHCGISLWFFFFFSILLIVCANLHGCKQAFL